MARAAIGRQARMLSFAPMPPSDPYSPLDPFLTGPPRTRGPRRDRHARGPVVRVRRCHARRAPATSGVALDGAPGATAGDVSEQLQRTQDARPTRSASFPSSSDPETAGRIPRAASGRSRVGPLPSTTVSESISRLADRARTSRRAGRGAALARGVGTVWRSRTAHGVQAAPGAPRGLKPLGSRGGGKKDRGSGGESLARSAARKAYAAMHKAP
jgi:hypothetical protein